MIAVFILIHRSDLEVTMVKQVWTGLKLWRNLEAGTSIIYTPFPISPFPSIQMYYESNPLSKRNENLPNQKEKVRRKGAIAKWTRWTTPWRTLHKNAWAIRTPAYEELPPFWVCYPAARPLSLSLSPSPSLASAIASEYCTESIEVQAEGEERTPYIARRKRRRVGFLLMAHLFLLHRGSSRDHRLNHIFQSLRHTSLSDSRKYHFFSTAFAMLKL